MEATMNTNTHRALSVGALLRTTLTAMLVVVAFAACGGSGGGSGRDAGSTSAASGSGAGSSGGSAGSGGGIVGGGGTGGEAAFQSTVYPLLTEHCTNCHSGGGPGFPDLSHPDVGTAYRATIDNQKVNLNNPAASRVAVKLPDENHNCWSADCNADAAEMTAAVTAWANMVSDPNAGGGNTGGAPGGGNGQVISSFQNSFANAQQAANTRFENNIIALWEFEEGEGNVAADTSGMAPAMDLTLEGVDWVSGGGIEIQSGAATADRADSIKLFNMIASGSGTQQYSIEAWIIPANTSQEGPARIVSYSQGTGRRNFTMGQEMYNYNFRNRNVSDNSNLQGTPALVTADADEDLQATLQHVVMTYDPTNGRRIYVNGVNTGDEDPIEGALLANWNPEYTFLLGNETSGNRLWLGQFKLVAIYNMAISPAQIAQNYLAGAADKFTLRFGLDEWLEAGSYVELEVSEFDAFSYLFCFPTISLPNPNGTMVEHLRVAVNGVAPVQSQSFRAVSELVDEANERVSERCSLVPKDLGVQNDMFSIWFDRLGANSMPMVEDPPTPAVDDSIADPLPDIFVRNFAQVNDTMSTLTGVPALAGAVADTFEELTQQLPANNDVRSFVSSQQVAISKLALEYCDLMVDSAALRQAFFGAAFEFNQPSATAFSTQAKQDLIINALINNMIGTGLADQPTPQEAAPILDGLIDGMTAGCNANNCDAERTRGIVKGACSAVLSSAAVHIQ